MYSICLSINQRSMETGKNDLSNKRTSHLILPKKPLPREAVAFWTFRFKAHDYHNMFSLVIKWKKKTVVNTGFLIRTYKQKVISPFPPPSFPSFRAIVLYYSRYGVARGAGKRMRKAVWWPFQIKLVGWSRRHSRVREATAMSVGGEGESLRICQPFHTCKNHRK